MVKGIDHLGIAVASIEEARPFYAQLGLTVEHIEEVPQEKVRVAIIPCGGSRIELLEPTSEDSPIAKFLAKRGPGIHHICLATDDVQAEGNGLQAAGFELLRPQPTPGADGCWVNFIHPKSAGGVLVEISEKREPL
ncbi:MAG: methylmalonyl-CoA epimerase [Acidobacteria bacterium]|nr:methylmalonyl-CoA epimerase [Acidobacteriota bacterium]